MNISVIPIVLVLLVLLSLGIAGLAMLRSVTRSGGSGSLTFGGLICGLLFCFLGFVLLAVPMYLSLQHHSSPSRVVAGSFDQESPQSPHSVVDEVSTVHALAMPEAPRPSQEPSPPDSRTQIAENVPTAVQQVQLAESPATVGIPVLPSEQAATPTPALPEWVSQAPNISDGVTYMTVTSGQFSTIEEAEADALEKAAVTLTDYLHQTDPETAGWSVPMALARKYAIHDRAVETIRRDFGPITAAMHRLHLQVELSSSVREKLKEPWQASMVEHRLVTLAAMIGLITLFLGTTASYFRLDTATHGQYRGRLKVAAASMAVAGTAAASMIILHV